jgi:hypothetical protein
MMTRQEIEELLARPTITPSELQRSGILPLGRNSIYDAINRGELEVVGIGKKKAIITAPLRKKLGL